MRDGIERDAVLAELERLLVSTPFRQAERSSTLLRYLVDQALSGTADRLKEYTVGLEALGRDTDFDPRTDPIVRAEASRLRGRLERYYAEEGRDAPLTISLPRGAYTVRFEQRPAEVSAPVALPTVTSVASRSRQPWLWLTAGLAGLGMVFLPGAFSRPTEIERDPKIYPVALQTNERIASDVGTSVAVAPDGKSVVYVSIDSMATKHLRLHRFDGSSPVDLPGTLGARAPFWSPDGRWIGYWAERQLRKIAVDGGSPEVLCDAPDLLGATWGSNNTIVAAIDASNRLFRIDVTRQTPPTPVLDLSANRSAALWPQLLPDGEHVLYTALSAEGVDLASIEVASLRSGERKVLVKGGTFARFVAPNHLTYVNQGTLFAIDFDATQLRVTGSATPIIDSISYSSTFGFAQVSFSETGTLVYRRNVPSIVARVERSGARRNLLERAGQYAWPALSPNGQRLAVVTIESAVSALAVFDLHTPARRAWSAPNLDAVMWTSDGDALIARNDKNGLQWLSASDGKARTFFDARNIVIPWSFMSGDRGVAVAILDTATHFDLWTASVQRLGDSVHAGTPRTLLRTNAIETYPAISPDGRWLAYTSHASGVAELYVRSLDDTSQVLRVARGARAARWSPFSNELLFTNVDHRLMAITYRVRDRRFIASTPQEWAPIELSDTDVLPNFNLGSDSESVVALLPVRPAERNLVQVVEEVTALLRRRREQQRH